MKPVPAVQICSNVLEKMVRHACHDYPVECCGLLSGKGQVIDRIHTATNRIGSASEFELPPEQLFALFKELRVQARQLLGIYHSHPNTPAQPSSRDVGGFHYPGVSYWIVSLKDRQPQVGCFLWQSKGFREVVFEVAGGKQGRFPLKL